MQYEVYLMTPWSKNEAILHISQPNEEKSVKMLSVAKDISGLPVVTGKILIRDQNKIAVFAKLPCPVTTECLDAI